MPALPVKAKPKRPADTRLAGSEPVSIDMIPVTRVTRAGL
jgi:hypothetical protein